MVGALLALGPHFFCFLFLRAALHPHGPHGNHRKGGSGVLVGAGDGGRSSEQLDLTVPSPPARLASVIHVTGSVGRCRMMIIVVIVIAEHIDCAGAGHTPRAGLPAAPGLRSRPLLAL